MVGIGENRQRRYQGDGFRQSRRRTAADGDAAIRAQRLGLFARLFGNLDRHVHHGLVEQSGGARAQAIHHLLSFFALLGRGQHQRASGAQPLDLFG